jgi:hypothetical protein
MYKVPNNSERPGKDSYEDILAGIFAYIKLLKGCPMILTGIALVQACKTSRDEQNQDKELAESYNLNLVIGRRIVSTQILHVIFRLQRDLLSQRSIPKPEMQRHLLMSLLVIIVARKLNKRSPTCRYWPSFA